MKDAASKTYFNRTSRKKQAILEKKKERLLIQAAFHQKEKVGANLVGLRLFAWAILSPSPRAKWVKEQRLFQGNILPHRNQHQRTSYQCSRPFEESSRTVSKGINEILDKRRMRPHSQMRRFHIINVSFLQIFPNSLYPVGLDKTWHTGTKNAYGRTKSQE